MFKSLFGRVPWVPLVLIAAVGMIGRLEFMRNLEWRSLDWRTQLRTRFQSPPDPRLAIILFEDKTEQELKLPWPVDRSVHARLIQLLALSETKVVSWDVILDASREGDGDGVMGEVAQAAIAAGTQVVSAAVTDPNGSETSQTGLTRPLSHVEGDIGRLLGDEHAFVPFAQLRAASWYGFADTPPGNDGVCREIPLMVRVGRDVYPTLSLQTLLLYFGVNTDDVQVRLGDAVYFSAGNRQFRLPVSADGRFLLNYRYDRLGLRTDFPTYSYGDVFFELTRLHLGDQKPASPPPDFKGKVVFIGQTVVGKADTGQSPLAARSPLVYVHANLVNNVLAGDFAREVPGVLAWGLVAGLALMGMRVNRKGKPWALVWFSLLSLVLYGTAAFALWVGFSLWLALMAPLSALAAVQFWQVVVRVRQEQRAKEQIRGMFNSYLSPELLNRMMKQGGLSTVGSERKPVTILFSDLRDFTSWSERTQQDALIAQLNEYLAAMVECIHEHGGTLHKFIGDAVMAVWGDLVSEGPAEDTAKACHAALAMQRRLEELNRSWAERGQHTLKMGIGINHGVVLAGNIGSPRRMEFTVIGDAVNLASRLEGLNKELKTAILTGESVYALVSQRFDLRPLGGVSVKGKAQPVAVFELNPDFRA
jgi:adenylate cyclase